MTVERYSKTVHTVIAACLILGCAVVALVGQAPEAVGPGSLATVAAEIRQLRVALEASTRSQTQTQALGVYLSAQQSRLLQAAGRRDAAQRELDRVTTQSREMSADLTAAEERLRNARSEVRGNLQEHLKLLQQEFSRIARQLQQAQSREAEASQVLQTEEARWTDLINRLEQLVNK